MLDAAAVLLLVLALAHSWLGERYLLTRLFRKCELPALLGSPDFAKNTLRFVWHLVTVLAIGMAVLLVQLGGAAPAARLVATLGWTCIASGLLPLVFTRARHLSWIVLFGAGALCLLAVG